MFGDFSEDFAEYDAKHYNNDCRDQSVLCKEGKLKELTRERNDEDYQHDGKNGKQQCRAKFVERARDAINQQEVNCEGDKDRGRSEFVAREVLEMRSDGERKHTNGDSDADRNRILHDVACEAVLDTFGIVL